MLPFLNDLIQRGLAEDIGNGDVTTEAVIPDDASASAEIKAKQDLVVAGIDVAGEVFHHLDPSLSFEPLVPDGGATKPGTVLARASGRTRYLLAGERVALNLLQHLSGIATLTARYVEQVKGTRAAVLDTRKTLPGLRALEKYAVRMGGGRNHRFGLYDGVLIKDNHIIAAGSITKAVERSRQKTHHLLKIEVETTSIDEVREALAAGADSIMLDNMPIAMMKEAVALIANGALTEASGTITLDTVRAVAETGVDFISVGTITHSAPAADISMKLL